MGAKFAQRCPRCHAATHYDFSQDVGKNSGEHLRAYLSDINKWSAEEVITTLRQRARSGKSRDSLLMPQDDYILHYDDAGAMFKYWFGTDTLKNQCG